MSKIALYIEKTEQGKYAVRRPGSTRASAVLPTRDEAIAKAREIGRGVADIYIERVRNTTIGGRDRWRLIGA